MLALSPGNSNSGMAIKIILMILPAVIHQKVFLFGNQR